MIDTKCDMVCRHTVITAKPANTAGCIKNTPLTTWVTYFRCMLRFFLSITIHTSWEILFMTSKNYQFPREARRFLRIHSAFSSLLLRYYIKVLFGVKRLINWKMFEITSFIRRRLLKLTWGGHHLWIKNVFSTGIKILNLNLEVQDALILTYLHLLLPSRKAGH